MAGISSIIFFFAICSLFVILLNETRTRARKLRPYHYRLRLWREERCFVILRSILLPTKLKVTIVRTVNGGGNLSKHHDFSFSINNMDNDTVRTQHHGTLNIIIKSLVCFVLTTLSCVSEWASGIVEMQFCSRFFQMYHFS